MRRTLTVLVTAAAFVLPAGAASAAVTTELSPTSTNASCNNSKGGNYDWTAMQHSGKGAAARADVDCAVHVDLPSRGGSKGPVDEEPPVVISPS